LNTQTLPRYATDWHHSFSPAFSLAKAIRAPQTFWGLITVDPDVAITLANITSR